MCLINEKMIPQLEGIYNVDIGTLICSVHYNKIINLLSTALDGNIILFSKNWILLIYFHFKISDFTTKDRKLTISVN